MIGITSTVDPVRAIDKPWVNHLYCAPHSFHLSSSGPYPQGTGRIGGTEVQAAFSVSGSALRPLRKLE